MQAEGTYYTKKYSITCTFWYCTLWSHKNDWISNLNGTTHFASKPLHHMLNHILMYKPSSSRHLTILCNPIWRNFLTKQKLCSSTKCLSHHSVLVFSQSSGMSHHTNTLYTKKIMNQWFDKSTHCSHSCGICLSLHKNFATTLSWSRDTVWEDQITVKWIDQQESTV